MQDQSISLIKNNIVLNSAKSSTNLQLKSTYQNRHNLYGFDGGVLKISYRSQIEVLLGVLNFEPLTCNAVPSSLSHKP